MARNILLNLTERKVLKDVEAVHLQPLEFTPLEFFMRNRQVFSAEDLLRQVWKTSEGCSADLIYACIRRLRKGQDTDGQTSIIRTLHGVGYGLDA